MHPFEGFLDRVEREGNVVTVRLVAGGFDPQPAAAPVLLVEVASPRDATLYEALAQLQREDSGCYFSLLSPQEARLTSDHGAEVVLRGAHVAVTESSFNAKDYERLAKQNHEWGMSQSRALREQSERIARMLALANVQRSRILVKAQGHAPGSTARTLYEQRLSFLSRLLDGEA